MIAIKLMTDGIIRGPEAMDYFVITTIPVLILRIVIGRIFVGHFGSTEMWMAWPFGWIVTFTLTVIFYRRIVTCRKHVTLS